MPHMEGIFINGEKAKFHPEDILDTDASQYTEEIGESVTAYLTEHITNPSNPPIDTSLSIAGAAADAKKTGDEISQLKKDLNYVLPKEVATYIPKNGTHAGTQLTRYQGYIDLNGVFQSSSSYSASEYIEIQTYAIIESHAYGVTSICTIAFYDENKTFISGISALSNWGAVSGVQTIPATAKYFRITMMNADTSAYIIVTSAERYSTEELNQAIETINAKLENTTIVNVADIIGSSGYIDADGNFQSSASWVVTDYIQCKSIIAISDHVQIFSSVPYVAYYDKYKVFINAVEYASTGIKNISLEIPSDAYYLRLNYYKHDTTQYYSVTTDQRVASAIYAHNACDPLYGKKIGAVGDSITIGTYSTPNMTYINQIANAHNMSVNNQAIWGSVFPTGKTDSNNNAKGSIYSQIAGLSSDCDMLIISGGINDAEYYATDEYWGSISGGYTAALDTTTFCGAFEGTLKSALDKFKGKPILFVFEHRMTQTYQSTYGQHFENVQYPLMVEMLNKWGVPYVDLFHDMPSIKLTDGYISLYSFDDQGVHPNIMGYRKFYVPRVESKLVDLMK